MVLCLDIARLADIIRAAMTQRKPRRPTQPTMAARQRRRENKSRRSRLKAQRRTLE